MWGTLRIWAVPPRGWRSTGPGARAYYAAAGERLRRTALRGGAANALMRRSSRLASCASYLDAGMALLGVDRSVLCNVAVEVSTTEPTKDRTGAPPGEHLRRRRQEPGALLRMCLTGLIAIPCALREAPEAPHCASTRRPLADMSCTCLV